MKKYKSINSLYFGKAEYFLSDISGNQLHMSINYKKKTYHFKVEKHASSNFAYLHKDATKFAKELLKRKSGINIAKG